MSQPTIQPRMTVAEAKILVRRIKLQLLNPLERSALDRLRGRLEAAIAGVEGDVPPEAA